ncbi:autotransporter domain-containing protein [Phycisphaerales bacterium AB-hyl4]|uniref:Autotransporter domain-containing protein n=1 Tax=Natronomicrosphaera hydrolytica TaxID=3242702 RepID=A0ABV4TZQ5_9BACT
MGRLQASVWMSAVAVTWALAAGPSFAATITWTGDGGGDPSWNNAGNWDDSSPPQPGDDLVFAGQDQLSAFNNLGDGISYGGITFNSTAGAFTLAGDDIVIAAGGSLVNQSSSTQNIALDIEAAGNLNLNANAGNLQVLGNVAISDAASTLTVLGGSNTRFGGQVTGDGALAFQGGGQLTLTRANTYSGGTTIDGGNVLIENHQAFGTGDVSVTGNSFLAANAELDNAIANDFNISSGVTLTLGGDEQMSFAGNLSGEGNILKTDDAFVILVGDDSTDFTGTLTIEDGVIALATPLGGDVVLNDGELQIFADDVVAADQDLTLAGGTLVVGGNHALDANVQLTGDINVLGGEFVTLEFGGPFQVQGDRTLDIAADTRLLLDNLTSDTAGRTLTMVGNGWLEIADDGSNFNGDVLMNAGTLAVGGDLNANITVNDGAQLQGNGSIVGNVRINTGGSHAAGQSIEGNYTLVSGGQLSISYNVVNGEINATSLDIDGQATLEQNSTVAISGQGTIAVGDSIVAITTTDGITDFGALLDAQSSFLVWSSAVVGNNYVLTALQGSLFVDDAVGRNNRAVATALDRMALTGINDSQQAMLEELEQLLETDNAAYNRALRQLAPEQVQAMPTTIVQVARNMQQTFSTRMGQQRLGIVAAPGSSSPNASPTFAGVGGLSLASAELSPTMLAHAISAAQPGQPRVDPRLQTRDFVHDWHVDVQTFGLYRSQDRSGEQLGYTAHTGGFLVSADRSITPNWRVGMNAGYAHSNFDFRDNRGAGYTDHFRAGPYASYNRGDWFVDTALSAGYHRNSLSRRVNVGQFEAGASADSQDFDVAAYLGAGYDFQLPYGVTLTPFAALDYLFYMQGSFNESGAGPANLEVDRTTTNSLNTTFGARAFHVIPVGNAVVVPELTLGYRYALFDEHETTARFAGTPTSFTVTNDLDSKHTALLGAGASALIGETISIYGKLQSELGSNNTNHLLSLGMQFRF